MDGKKKAHGILCFVMVWGDAVGWFGCFPFAFFHCSVRLRWLPLGAWGWIGAHHKCIMGQASIQPFHSSSRAMSGSLRIERASTDPAPKNHTASHACQVTFSPPLHCLLNNRLGGGRIALASWPSQSVIHSFMRRRPAARRFFVCQSASDDVPRLRIFHPRPSPQSID